MLNSTKLAIGIWSTIAEEDLKRKQIDSRYVGLVETHLLTALNTIIRGLLFAENPEDMRDTTEFPQDQCTVQAAWTLENVAKVAGSNIIDPIFNFIY